MRAAVSYVNQQARHRDPDRPRGDHQGDAPSAPASTSTGPASRSSMPGCRAATPTMPTSSTRGCSARATCFRDCQRLINNDRNHFAACMVALGDADAMVTGVTRNYSTALDDVRRVIDAKPGHRVIGVSIVLCPRPHRARRRHRRPRHADAGETRRHRRGGRRRRPPHGLRAARRDARLFDLRPPRGRALGARARGGQDPRQAPRRFRV